jgi:hypothetical protein
MITPEEIRQVGTRSTVEFRDVSPKDRNNLVQQAIALFDKGLMSADTAMTDYIGIDNADRERDKIQRELIFKDPEMLKNVFTPWALYRHDPVLFQLWLVMQQHQFNEYLKTQAPPALAPGAPAGPSVGGLPGIPPPPGAAPTLTPFQQGPQLVNPLEHALASAMGGADFQRQPGISGAGGMMPFGNSPRF